MKIFLGGHFKSYQFELWNLIELFWQCVSFTFPSHLCIYALRISLSFKYMITTVKKNHKMAKLRQKIDALVWSNNYKKIDGLQCQVSLNSKYCSMFWL